MKQENTPPVPQGYEEFHKCMEFLRQKNEQEEEFNDIISKISYDGYAFIFGDWFIQYINLLNKMWKIPEDADDISYFVYDAEWGDKADKYYITETLPDGSKKEYHFYNDKDLYDYLVQCYPKRCVSAKED